MTRLNPPISLLMGRDWAEAKSDGRTVKKGSSVSVTAKL